MKKRGADYYWNARDKIYARLSQLPQGTIKERLISGRTYFYFQRREGEKVVHTYIGKELPDNLKKQMFERQALRAQLQKIQDAMLKIVAEKIKGLG
ncbi:MAG: hypothetical protein Q7S13_01015 [Candidatus Omnitrophota bacterium]|nr:hypothetical protein [Candidatus Omnitrophota bacterium]